MFEELEQTTYEFDTTDILSEIYVYKQEGLSNKEATQKVVAIYNLDKEAVEELVKEHRRLLKVKTDLLYIFYNTELNRTKIGVSNDAYKRLIDIRNISGCDIICKYIGDTTNLPLNPQRPFNDAYRIEKELHRHFSEHRGIGEWFNFHYIIPMLYLLNEGAPNIRDEYMSYKKDITIGGGDNYPMFQSNNNKFSSEEAVLLSQKRKDYLDNCGVFIPGYLRNDLIFI